MHTVHETLVHATPEAVFAIAADVERWPQLLRAYRWCQVLDRQQDRLVFEMAGRIRGWPARWTAVQSRSPSEHRIVFHHMRGITAGMVVEWRLQPVSEGTRVTIVHDLLLRWPLAGRLISNLIVGPVFIDWIAHQTLVAVKTAAERGEPW